MVQGKGVQEIKVGEKIKHLRTEKGFSLKEMAERTGFSSALLSQVENHLVSPSLGTIIKIAKALGVMVGYFLDLGPGEPYTIVRKDERRSVSRFASKDGVSYGYRYESLGYDKKSRHMEPFFITLEPPTVKDLKLSIHEGEEFIFVLEGEMEVILGDHSDVLRPGDAIYYDSSMPHRVQCRGGKEAKILAVLYTPLEEVR